MEVRSKYLSHTVHYMKFTHDICGLTESSQWPWEVQIIIVFIISNSFLQVIQKPIPELGLRMI